MATQSGAAADATSQNSDTNIESRQNRASNAPRERPLTDREKMIEGLAERHTLARQEDERRVLAERAAEAAGEPATDTPSGEQTQPAVAAPTATPAGNSSELGDLGDYIVVQGGKPMIKLKVDGKEQLVALDTARVQLQKHTAADQRLARAAEAQRQNEAREIALRERDTQLREREARIAVEESKRSQPATAASAAPAVDDQTLDISAREIVDSLLVQPADVAAKTLAKTLRSLRQAPASAQPAVDPDEVAKKAAAAAAHQIRYETAMATGFNEFRTQYSDIAADEALMQLADNRTTGIAKEHPDWTPSQVMLEAGRQTREWMTSHGMATPAAETQTPPPKKSAVDRETAKRNLRPMPVARTATPAPAANDGPERDDPRTALQEMRKSRGQPV